jgi:hypothetical protein
MRPVGRSLRAHTNVSLASGDGPLAAMLARSTGTVKEATSQILTAISAAATGPTS